MSCIIIKSIVYCVYVTKKVVVVISGSVVSRDKNDGGCYSWNGIYPLQAFKKKEWVHDLLVESIISN